MSLQYQVVVRRSRVPRITLLSSSTFAILSSMMFDQAIPLNEPPGLSLGELDPEKPCSDCMDSAIGIQDLVRRNGLISGS